MKSVGGVIGSGMDNVNVGPGDVATGTADGGQQLFVDTATETKVGAVANQFDVIDDGDIDVAVVARRGAMDLHDVAEDVVGMGPVGQRTQLSSTFRGDRVVGVHPEGPFAASVLQ